MVSDTFIQLMQLCCVNNIFIAAKFLVFRNTERDSIELVFLYEFLTVTTKLFLFC